ncbi:hypothetical protein B296_00004703 [Ensete ventricosum]|uniref:Uncharacterized protein n=1 Tax=Ensete ventricosum TaxID=4639 RepID=A0A426XE08_ENSVE|nr:hypothetical protein B296_00004703 [Ensete ventricosum]
MSLAATPTIGVATLGRHLVGRRVSCPYAALLWVPTLCGLVAGIAPCGLVVGTALASSHPCRGPGRSRPPLQRA